MNFNLIMVFPLICKKTLDSLGFDFSVKYRAYRQQRPRSSVQVSTLLNVGSSVHTQNVQTQDLRSQMDAGLISIYHLQRYVKVYKIRS